MPLSDWPRKSGPSSFGLRLHMVPLTAREAALLAGPLAECQELFQVEKGGAEHKNNAGSPAPPTEEGRSVRHVTPLDL